MITRREFQFACLASLIVSSCGNDAHASLATVQLPSAAWTQWGGPKRNFTAPLLTDGDNLPTPQLVWKRELGKGHAAIVSDGKYAYSLRLDKQQEVLEKCSVETGDLIWTSRYAIGFHASIAEYDGPHSTPVLLDDRIVVVGIDAGVHAFDVLTGKALWSRDLQTDVGTILPQSGYAASPLVWRGQLIVPTLGNARSDETERYEPNFMGKGIPGAVALDIRTGKEICAANPSGRATRLRS